jgi:addiction module RelE/StbE family toxin
VKPKKVRWLESALRTLGEHVDYIAEDSPKVARSIVHLIHKAVENLSSFTHLGRPGRVKGTRELVIARTPYVVIYRVKSDEVQILIVLHSSQKWD